MSVPACAIVVSSFSVEDPACHDDAPLRIEPVSFAGCMGWLHPASGDVGVLLCPGVGYEGRAGHRPLLVLADRLACAGYSTLRFQYLGTGDSCDPVDEDLLEAWQRSVHAAVGQLRQMTGVRRVVMVGLRLGATLAAVEAVRREDVDAVILLAPLISGKGYVRELNLISRMHRDTRSAQDGDCLETDDFRLPTPTVRALERLDLRKLPKLAGQVLILNSATSAESDAFAQGLRANGTAVTETPFQRYYQMMRIIDDAEMPENDINDVVSWLQSTIPQKEMRDPVLAAIEGARLLADEWVETPLRFGGRGGLSGILCEPSGARGEEAHVVVIGNMGTDPHYGLGRFHVMLSRNLASQGVSSLRFNFAGLGDSDSLPDNARSFAYDTDRTRDFTAAIDSLESRGYRRFTAAGLCSGAYHAFHAALRDSRISGIVMINLALFEWVPGMLLSDKMRETPKRAQTYISNIKDVSTWKRLIRGEINIKQVTRNILRLIIRSLSFALIAAVNRFSGESKYSLPQESLLTLSKRSVKILFLRSSEDNLVWPVEKNFGAKGRGLATLPGVTVKILAGSDHALSRHVMRIEASKAVAEFARENAASSPKNLTGWNSHLTKRGHLFYASSGNNIST